jgi:hypothetical protein
MLLHPSMIFMIVKDDSAIANQMELFFRDWVHYASIKATNTTRLQNESIYCCGVIPHRLRWSTIGSRNLKTILVSRIVMQ